MAKPVLSAVDVFDAKLGTMAYFKIYTHYQSPDVIVNYAWNIYDGSEDEQICSYDSSRGSSDSLNLSYSLNNGWGFQIPPNDKLINRNSNYYLKIRIQLTGETSYGEYSSPVVLYCKEKPVLAFNNLSKETDNVIQMSATVFEMSYTAITEQGETLSTYKYRFYNSDKNLIDESDTYYGSITHSFSVYNLTSGETYYVQGIGLSMQDGEAMDRVATGGFVTFRNNWKFSGWAYVLNSYFGYSDQDIGVIIIRRNGVISVYDFNMQKKATLSGADATTVFDGTLHIGENMIAPPIADSNKLKGKVYECKVYNEALTTGMLEAMFPNIYSNEVRTKGAVTFYIPNLQYKTQLLRYLFLEAVVDMGDYSAPEYAGKYPKAVGIRVDGVPDIIWCPTGSNTHVRKVFYAPKYIAPYGNIIARIVNTGLAPDLQATVKAFRCTLLTEEQAVTDAADALDFVVEWDKEEPAVEVGGTLTGHVSYLPEDANSGTSLTLTVTGDAATAEFKDDMITVTGAKNGEVNIEATLPYGTKKVFNVKIGSGVTDTTDSSTTTE